MVSGDKKMDSQSAWPDVAELNNIGPSSVITARCYMLQSAWPDATVSMVRCYSQHS